MSTTITRRSRRIKRHRKSVEKKYPGTPLTITAPPTNYFAWKSTVDFCLALILLLPGLPLLAISYILVRLTSRGPVIFRQHRVGRGGEVFTLYKIRSMTIDAEIRTGPAWAQSDDPRVTLIGHILRKFHLDELPQLFNVLKGEMSLVGPRPERPEFVEVLKQKIPSYANRLAVQPGITGLSQLNLPPDFDVDCVQRKVILDIEYIQNANLWLDLRLIACTALRFLKLPTIGLFGLHRCVVLPSKVTKDQVALVKEVVTLKEIQDHQHHMKGKNSRNGGDDFSSRRPPNKPR